MKPTQEQVIAWAQIAGMERCNCEPRCHLHTGGMGSLTTLATLAYEAGRKDENEACAKVGEFYVSASNTKNEPGIALVIKDYMRNIRARREQ